MPIFTILSHTYLEFHKKITFFSFLISNDSFASLMYSQCDQVVPLGEKKGTLKDFFFFFLYTCATISLHHVCLPFIIGKINLINKIIHRGLFI